MEAFQIILSPENLLVFEKRSVEIDTVFYVHAGNVAFPDRQWTDYTLNVLSMWAESFYRNYASKHAVYTFPFMDGPYEITVTQDNGQMSMTGVNFRNDRHEVFNCICSTDDFCRELLLALNQLRTMIWSCDSFQSQNSKQSVLAIIDYYRAILKSVVDTLIS